MKMDYKISKERETDVQYIRLLTQGKIKSTCIPSMLILGEPGAGKTSFGKYLAKELNANFIFAPCYDGVGAEQLVYNWDLGILVDAMTDEHTKGRHAMKDGYLLQALKKSHDGLVVLLIDEIDKAKPSVDTFLLTFLQECMLNDPLTGVVKGKKENIFIIFTSNERRELEDALDRRFTLIRKFNFPDKENLIKQVDSMVFIPYNSTKKEFLINLAITYRSLQIEKKPAQSQIADLIQELYSIGESSIGRKSSYKMKFHSMLWKFSQVEEDHKRFIQFLSQKFKLQESKLTSYIGSML